MDGLSGGLVGLVAVWVGVGTLVLAGVVARDAHRHGHSGLLWFVCALLLPGFGALAYLVQRGAALPAMPSAAAPGVPQAPEMPAASAEPLAVPVTPIRPAARESASLPAAWAAGGAVEWRRGVGVLTEAPAAEPVPATPPPAPPPARSRRPLGWLLGAVLVLGALTAAGLALTSGWVALPWSAPPAAPLPAPTAAPVVPTALPLAAPAPPAPEPTPAASEPTYYTVAEGDTLGEIALRHNTTIEALLQANGLDDADMLVVGQRLLVSP